MEQKNGHYIFYYPNGNKKLEIWYKNNAYHRIDGPAFILYFQKNNVKQIENWWLNGLCHRPIDEGPAYITRYIDNSLQNEEWWLNGLRHRPLEQGPAKIFYGVIDEYDDQEGDCLDQSYAYMKYFMNNIEVPDEKVEQFILEYKLHIYNTACLYFDEKALANIISDYSIEEI